MRQNPPLSDFRSLSDFKVEGFVLPRHPAPPERALPARARVDDFAACHLALSERDGTDAALLEAFDYSAYCAPDGGRVETVRTRPISPDDRATRLVRIINGQSPLMNQCLWLFGPHFRGPGDAPRETVLHQLYAVIGALECVQVLSDSVGCLVCSSPRTDELAEQWAACASNRARSHAETRDWDRVHREVRCALALLDAREAPLSENLAIDDGLRVWVRAKALHVLAAARTGRTAPFRSASEMQREHVRVAVSELENSLTTPLTRTIVQQVASTTKTLSFELMRNPGDEDPLWVVRIGARPAMTVPPTRDPARVVADLVSRRVITRIEADTARAYLVGLHSTPVDARDIDAELDRLGAEASTTHAPADVPF